eukprot:5637250-Pleurochrysis_carterae.AAC.3
MPMERARACALGRRPCARLGASTARARWVKARTCSANGVSGSRWKPFEVTSAPEERRASRRGWASSPAFASLARCSRRKTTADTPRRIEAQCAVRGVEEVCTRWWDRYSMAPSRTGCGAH